MKLPDREHAVLAESKFTEYLLRLGHEQGDAKARFLHEFGYRRENWRQLEVDIRQYHLDADVDVVRETRYGTRYEISAPLQTPSGRTLCVRTVWQVDTGTDFPRLITLVPD